MITIGIIREGKQPPDKRVPLTPEHCKFLLEKYISTLRIVLQPSSVRAYRDNEYTDLGIELNEDLSVCDLILGVKEVPISMLIPAKEFMFFSHTIKKQPYNQKLLQAILEKHISLIDYEVLTDAEGKRLIGFGKYAGIVGCYNGFLGLGKKWDSYTLKPAHQCHDQREVEAELHKVKLPKNFRLVLTGGGRVANGALEILSHINIKKVEPDQFLNTDFDGPVYTQLSVKDYVKRTDGMPFTTSDFYHSPGQFESNFMPFARKADMYIPCHFWDNRAPYIFTAQNALEPGFRIKLVADISCDIAGPIASTLRPSTIAAPFYGYDPITGKETDFMHSEAIGVMAIDNLPCELPRDASDYFGNELINNIIPELLGKVKSEVIERARISDLNGNLTPRFENLSEYAEGKLI